MRDMSRRNFFNASILTHRGAKTRGLAKRRSYTCDIPCRAFLPKKVGNLLLAGECLSCTHDWFYGYRLIPWCMRTGEVAATAAVMAIQQRIPPKEIKWTSGYFSD
jgi:FAD dependent oxidoreductase